MDTRCRSSRNTDAERHERRSLFVAAFAAWLSVSFGVAGAPIAHAGNSAQLSVSAVVVAKCNVTTRALDTAEDFAGSLQVACSQNAQAAQVDHGPRRSYSSPTYSGDVMVAMINF